MFAPQLLGCLLLISPLVRNLRWPAYELLHLRSGCSQTQIADVHISRGNVEIAIVFGGGHHLRRHRRRHRRRQHDDSDNDSELFPKQIACDTEGVLLRF